MLWLQPSDLACYFGSTIFIRGHEIWHSIKDKIMLALMDGNFTQERMGAYREKWEFVED